MIMRYYNKQTQEWYNEGDVLTKKVNDNSLFSGIPTAEQLSKWGFEPWSAPTLTLAEQLLRAKESKLRELDEYDKSSAVNSFTIGNREMWLSVDQRQQIATQISANEAAGRESMTRWFGGVSYTFTLPIWKQMLVALEIYAGDAINMTESHRAAINALETIEDVDEYDFTVNYPSKLTF